LDLVVDQGVFCLSHVNIVYLLLNSIWIWLQLTLWSCWLDTYWLRLSFLWPCLQSDWPYDIDSAQALMIWTPSSNVCNF